MLTHTILVRSERNRMRKMDNEWVGRWMGRWVGRWMGRWFRG